MNATSSGDGLRPTTWSGIPRAPVGDCDPAHPIEVPGVVVEVADEEYRRSLEPFLADHVERELQPRRDACSCAERVRSRGFSARRGALPGREREPRRRSERTAAARAQGCRGVGPDTPCPRRATSPYAAVRADRDGRASRRSARRCPRRCSPTRRARRRHSTTRATATSPSAADAAPRRGATATRPTSAATTPTRRRRTVVALRANAPASPSGIQAGALTTPSSSSGRSDRRAPWRPIRPAPRATTRHVLRRRRAPAVSRRERARLAARLRSGVGRATDSRSSRIARATGSPAARGPRARSQRRGEPTATSAGRAEDRPAAASSPTRRPGVTRVVGSGSSAGLRNVGASARTAASGTRGRTRHDGRRDAPDRARAAEHHRGQRDVPDAVTGTHAAVETREPLCHRDPSEPVASPSASIRRRQSTTNGPVSTRTRIASACRASTTTSTTYENGSPKNGRAGSTERANRR